MNHRKYRNTASFGKRQEFVAISELLKHHFDVYLTLVDDQQIDCIIRKDVDPPIYADIQIKASSDECNSRDAGRFASIHMKPRLGYFFIFYSEHLKTYWIIPSETVAAKASHDKKGRYHIMLSGYKKGKPYTKKDFAEFENDRGFELLERYR